MKIYTCSGIKSFNKFMSVNTDKNIKLLSFNGHPTEREEQVKKFLSDNQDGEWLLYDTVALDYIPIEILYFIDSNGVCTKFSDKFKSELKHFYPGEIVLAGIVVKEP